MELLPDLHPFQYTKTVANVRILNSFMESIVKWSDAIMEGAIWEMVIALALMDGIQDSSASITPLPGWLPLDCHCSELQLSSYAAWFVVWTSAPEGVRGETGLDGVITNILEEVFLDRFKAGQIIAPVLKASKLDVIKCHPMSKL